MSVLPNLHYPGLEQDGGQSGGRSRPERSDSSGGGVRPLEKADTNNNGRGGRLMPSSSSSQTVAAVDGPIFPPPRRISPVRAARSDDDGNGDETAAEASSLSLSPVAGRGGGTGGSGDHGSCRGSPDTPKVSHRHHHHAQNAVSTTAAVAVLGSPTDVGGGGAQYGYEAGYSPDVAKHKLHQHHHHHQQERQHQHQHQHQQQQDRQHQQQERHQMLPPPHHHHGAKPPTFKARHVYDATAVPRRSSLKLSNSSHHSPKRGSDDHPMPDATTSTNVVEVRMRGERNPIQRRRSIDFARTVQVKEVQPISQLNEDVRELWLQADDFAAIKEHRRSLLKRYKEREASGQTIRSASYNHTSAITATATFAAAANANANAAAYATNNDDDGIGVGSYPLLFAATTTAPPPPPPPPDFSSTQAQAQQQPTSTTTATATTVVRMMSSSSEEENDSFRGLEKYIDKSGRRQKNMAWDTVLLEQDTQEVSGHFDEERIAELYRLQTQESPEKALARAAQDRAAVEEYLMSPRTTRLMQKTKMQAMRRLSC